MKAVKRPIEILTVAEVERLLGCCSAKASTGLRNRALIVAMWRGGLRVSEALALGPKDFDVEAGTLRVLHGKGDVARTVGIDPQAAAVLMAWLERRKALGLNGHQPFFCTLKGAAVSRFYAANLLRRLGIEAGIDKRVHPHGLRHAHASELMAEGASVGMIQKQLGHRNMLTTVRYLDHIRPEQVVAFMARRKAWGTVEGVEGQWFD